MKNKDNNGINPVSRVLLQPQQNDLKKKEVPAPEAKDIGFQLNSLGGPLDGDFTS